MDAPRAARDTPAIATGFHQPGRMSWRTTPSSVRMMQRSLGGRRVTRDPTVEPSGALCAHRSSALVQPTPAIVGATEPTTTSDKPRMSHGLRKRLDRGGARFGAGASIRSAYKGAHFAFKASRPGRQAAARHGRGAVLAMSSALMAAVILSPAAADVQRPLVTRVVLKRPAPSGDGFRLKLRTRYVDQAAGQRVIAFRASRSVAKAQPRGVSSSIWTITSASHRGAMLLDVLSARIKSPRGVTLWVGVFAGEPFGGELHRYRLLKAGVPGRKIG